MNEETKNLIANAKRICIIPPENDAESASAALALFYTLKDLGKNVNVLTETIPVKLQSLIPSLDFISQPQNFIIAVPKSAADISQIYYEKNEDQLKIHLTVHGGQLKKEHISFYAENAKPDLVITVGIQNFQQELTGRLNSFGFLLNIPILNIDNRPENLKFGLMNIVELKSFSETILGIIRDFGQNHIPQPVADCLIASLTEYLLKQKN